MCSANLASLRNEMKLERHVAGKENIRKTHSAKLKCVFDRSVKQRVLLKFAWFD